MSQKYLFVLGYVFIFALSIQAADNLAKDSTQFIQDSTLHKTPPKIFTEAPGICWPIRCRRLRGSRRILWIQSRKGLLRRRSGRTRKPFSWKPWEIPIPMWRIWRSWRTSLTGTGFRWWWIPPSPRRTWSGPSSMGPISWYIPPQNSSEDMGRRWAA